MEFENLGYRELQNLCKDFGLRANGKSSDLKERLRDYKLKLQASTTSHRRSSVSMSLSSALLDHEDDKDRVDHNESPEETTDENISKADNKSSTDKLRKEKRRKSSIVATFMEHIANNTKRLSLSEPTPIDATTSPTSIGTDKTHETCDENRKLTKPSFLPRMTMKALAMTKTIVKKTGENKSLQSNQEDKDTKKEITSTIPKPMPIATKKAPKQIQVNKPLSWKPHTGKLKEFNVDTKSIIREAGPYDENEDILNKASTSKSNIKATGIKNRPLKEKKVLSINKPLTYKPHTGKLKPANF